jgi:hypothetical protein
MKLISHFKEDLDRVYKNNYAQPGAAADVARRDVKWFKCVSLFAGKILSGRSRATRLSARPLGLTLVAIVEIYLRKKVVLTRLDWSAKY